MSLDERETEILRDLEVAGSRRDAEELAAIRLRRAGHSAPIVPEGAVFCCRCRFARRYGGTDYGPEYWSCESDTSYGPPDEVTGLRHRTSGSCEKNASRDCQYFEPPRTWRERLRVWWITPKGFTV